MSAAAVNALAPSAVAAADPTDPAARPTHAKPNTSKVAREFEEVFLHQILQSAHALGKGDSSGYAGMALDALASGLSDAGGIGLARSIQGVIDRAHLSEMKKDAPAEISPKGP